LGFFSYQLLVFCFGTTKNLWFWGQNCVKLNQFLNQYYYYLKINFMFFIFHFHCYVKECELCENIITHNYVHTL
jgi:hypothetical protein